MSFDFIDRITDLRPGERVEAIKTLTLAEEYLKDHFPRFPVMPGVLMLEAMFQASAWLIRQSEEFQHSVVVLKEARNTKYTGFVEPGQTLVVSAEIIKQDESTTTLKARGEIDGSGAVSSRLLVHRYNLRENDPAAAGKDAYMIEHLRRKFDLLYFPNAADEESEENTAEASESA
ncbi:MAG TPA: beta-hydroxyacyl-ACP dehydratase [Planctomycetaceae bacterium]|jgi:3-hydroxyacyl-[acyl-carrier-protein] dehydratase|nr:beta-hydroxyacyl-ACP dehydratase [Planctomycetaceae bacterium]|tara:strand:- start:5276 stop:5800 length:525 start_codon:yes stop_codon:yes gene_type:complete